MLKNFFVAVQMYLRKINEEQRSHINLQNLKFKALLITFWFFSGFPGLIPSQKGVIVAQSKSLRQFNEKKVPGFSSDTDGLYYKTFYGHNLWIFIIG
jgi:hypothetical protein